jgi:hypothetical protein
VRPFFGWAANAFFDEPAWAVKGFALALEMSMALIVVYGC